jgi:hypothetical protein
MMRLYQNMPDPEEPWLRGVLPGLDPVIEHLLRASEQIREDIARALEPLSVAQVWATPDGMTSAGFHAKHLAGSTGRLCTYMEEGVLEGGVLEGGAARIGDESSGTEPAADLLSDIVRAFDRYDSLVRSLRPEEFGAIRYIGRKRLETTAISLAIHIAEHGQRHVGQAISASKLARARVP